MLRRRFLISWLVITLLALTQTAAAQIAVVDRNVNLRPDPSSTHEPIRKLLPPEEVLLLRLEKTNNYYHVRTEPGELGWIWANNVDVSDRLPNWDAANIPEYDRDDWRHWIDADGDCQDTRQEVLIRGSQIPVAFEPRNDGRECRVESGQWVGPYGGETFTDPSDLDIDHVVPLRNAHVSGGWAWAEERRATYANEFLDPQHLLAVKNSLNRSKGAKGPEEWAPPDQAFRCDYGTVWKRIKESWRLSMNEAENDTVASVIDACP